MSRGSWLSRLERCSGVMRSRDWTPGYVVITNACEISWHCGSLLHHTNFSVVCGAAESLVRYQGPSYLLGFVQFDGGETAQEEEVCQFRQLIGNHGEIEKGPQISMKALQLQIREVPVSLLRTELYKHSSTRL